MWYFILLCVTTRACSIHSVYIGCANHFFFIWCFEALKGLVHRNSHIYNIVTLIMQQASFVAVLEICPVRIVKGSKSTYKQLVRLDRGHSSMASCLLASHLMVILYLTPGGIAVSGHTWILFLFSGIIFFIGTLCWWDRSWDHRAAHLLSLTSLFVENWSSHKLGPI